MIFLTLNEETQEIIQNNYKWINNCLERQFNYEFTEIVYSVNQFINTEFEYDVVPFYEEEY
ncbi:unnamed protein product (macronuclear) [Paramecium tetraurelia]|uniref:Uncharacterized protein n=1 Tax=Paramecium tetraurelia TaxID=5888 RepID=A0BJI5_PARTE|nr:uncharacterized protein GSPATT00029330001 [Paramecium tetraurelia]CAK58702.1 unnamed protein product [Paramecium tetraurelia]|eukprot:XP_001426100.1 hypothetical protein (macronuclear) [Paramecium tetraurelia strain d4-2]